jgi:hydroxysqualene dehydroxylase
MAAAVTLAAKEIPVTVFESGPVAGGRARRIVSHGHELDNGQHIFVGAYTELFRLMKQVGAPANALLRMPLEIRYARGFSLGTKLGLAAGLLTAQGVPLGEKMAAVRFMAFLKRENFTLKQDIPVSQLLARHGQNGRLGHFLWQPLCVSALNTPAEVASSNAFLAALRDTLAGVPGASDLVLPRVDLSRLFPEPASHYVASRGGDIRLKTMVNDLHELRKQFQRVIVAVGPHQLKTLVPRAPEYTYQPIYTCYLQYGERVKLRSPMLGMAEGLVQWVFDRGALLGERGRLACVISAQGDHQQMTQDEIADTCHRELASEGLVDDPPLWSRVIAEKRATITCSVGVERPPIEQHGVILAGDYTDPEYPPTLEAAVRSGVRAALKIAQ